MTASFAERQLGSVRDTLRIACPRALSATGDVLQLCRHALRNPIASTPIEELGRSAKDIAIIVSDSSREEPREAFLTALLEVLARDRVKLVVASGTHAGAGDSVVPQAFSDMPICVHDAADPTLVRSLGKTSKNTQVRLHHAVAEADLVIATGRVRPHYFAGVSGGVKAVFPGCAWAEDALQNHLLKADPSARLGRVDDNVCRLDMEEACSRVPGRVVILNVLCDVDGNAVAAASGDPVRAHRVLAAEATKVFSVSLPASDVLVVADKPPVSHTLYQASKLVPPAGAVLNAGGTVIVVADCSGGLGPLERVNRGIYALGLKPQLPEDHEIWLVSELADPVVAMSYARPKPSLRQALAEAERRHPGAELNALWRAGEAIVSRRVS